MKDGIINLECAEATVGNIKLDFIDPETQKPKVKPRTRPEVRLVHRFSGSLFPDVNKDRIKTLCTINQKQLSWGRLYYDTLPSSRDMFTI